MTDVDLDALDAARANVTSAELFVVGNRIFAELPGHPIVATDVPQTFAAYIVAMHAALPDLIAAARERDALRDAVLGLAAEHEKWARINGDMAQRVSAQGELEIEQYHLGMKWAQQVSADRIRATVTATLSGES